MREIVKSIIEQGSKSSDFNKFYDICLKMSIAYLFINRNKIIRNEIMRKMDYSIKDLARDCIDALFETKDDKFIQINSYFYKKYGAKLDKIHDDEMKGSLAILIISKTNQQLSHLREDLGEIFFKVKKSLSTYLARKKDLYKIIFHIDKKLVLLNHNIIYDLNLKPIPLEELLHELYKIKFRTSQVPEIIEAAFNIVQKKNEFCLAIPYNTLLNAVNNFYKGRLEFYTK